MPESTFPHFAARPGEITITPWSTQSLGTALVSTGQSVPASVNYVTANLAVFVPFWVPDTVVLTKMGLGNGAAVAGNVDLGVYDEAGVRLVSTGTTAQAGTSRIQVIDIGDTTLRRGIYYLAAASDTSGATQKWIAAIPAAGIAQSLGLLQMAAAFVLPANATYAKCTSAFIPLVIAQGYRTVGL
jgi:hypothetical protein